MSRDQQERQWREEGKGETYFASLEKEQPVTSFDLEWWHQIENKGIVAIIESCSSRIICFIMPKITWFCAGHNNASHAQINQTVCSVTGVAL